MSITSKLSTFPEINTLNLSLFVDFFSNDTKLHNANYASESAL